MTVSARIWWRDPALWPYVQRHVPAGYSVVTDVDQAAKLGHAAFAGLAPFRRNQYGLLWDTALDTGVAAVRAAVGVPGPVGASPVARLGDGAKAVRTVLPGRDLVVSSAGLVVSAAGWGTGGAVPLLPDPCTTLTPVDLAFRELTG